MGRDRAKKAAKMNVKRAVKKSEIGSGRPGRNRPDLRGGGKLPDATRSVGSAGGAYLYGEDPACQCAVMEAAP